MTATNGATKRAAKFTKPTLFNSTVAQHVRWSIAAHKAGLSFSEWLRRAAEAACEQQLPNHDFTEHFPLDDHTPEAEAVRREAAEA